MAILWRKPFSRQQTAFLNTSKIEHRSWKPLKKWNSPAIQGMRKNSYVCGRATENVYRRVRVPFPPLRRVDWYVAQLRLFIRMVFEDTTAKGDLLTSTKKCQRKGYFVFVGFVKETKLPLSNDVGDITTKVKLLFDLGNSALEDRIITRVELAGSRITMGPPESPYNVTSVSL